MSTDLKTTLTNDMKTAMRNKDKERLTTIRMTLSAIKQIEIDERKEVTDTDVLKIIQKMVKQRKDSASQFEQAGRAELAETENQEIEILQNYLPEQLQETEIIKLIDAAIAQTSASSMANMGKVMGQLRPQIQGRADMGQVSQLIKSKLG